MQQSLVARSAADSRQFAEDVASYLSLTPRQLPSRYLYDDLGSALFDAICHLPWYPVTRAERDLLALHSDEIFGRLSGVSSVIELGPGSGEKLALLLEAAARGPLAVHLVDVSPQALEEASTAINGFPDLSVVTHCATYETGLVEAARDRRAGGQALVLFLGSNIGNFDQPGADGFLRGMHATLLPGDALLLGADLVKPEGELLLAYDDPLGVTAAFNKNLLVHANRELGADFDLDSFAHRAVWNADASRVEMHLVSLRQQAVHVPSANLDIVFQPGETIWTESWYRYRPGEVVALLDRAGFRSLDQWTAGGFALTLAVR